MKLAYITRVTIPNKVAQAEQIKAMSYAFGAYLKDEFLLVSPTNNLIKALEFPFNHYSINIKITHKILRNLVFGIKVFKFLKKHEINYVYTRDILIAFISSVFFRIPTGYEAHQPIKGKVAMILHKIVSRNTEFKLVTITQSLKNYFSETLKYKNDIQVVRNGVFLQDYLNAPEKNILRDELGIPNDAFLIVHTGSLFQNRGFEKFEVILSRFPNVYLYQIGGGRYDIELLKPQLEHYKNMKFIDYQPKNIVVKYQMAANVLLYLTSTKSPIFWCTSPNKIFEYMATKNPILSPRIGSITEILNNKNSYLFDLENNEDLVSSLQKIISKSNNTRALFAFDEVKRTYSMENRVKKITQILTK